MPTYLITQPVYHDGVYYKATPNNPALVTSTTQPGGSTLYVEPTPPPSKPVVSQVETSNIATTSVTLDFVVVGVAGANYRVWVIYKAGADLLAATSAILAKVGTAGSTSVNLTGLTTGTQYQAIVYIHDIDSDPDAPSCSNPTSFATL